MPHHAELPQESIAGRASPANDPTVVSIEPASAEFDDNSGPARTPLRFGRLALWMASASALAVGVLGTVAYSMWFTHDQRVYAEAMSSARKTLGIDQPLLAAAPAQTQPQPETQTQATGAVERLSSVPSGVPYYSSVDSDDRADTAGTAGLAAISAAAAAQDVNTPPSTPSTLAQQRPGKAPLTTANRPNRAASTQTAQQNQSTQAARRHASRARSDSGLFARVGAFFHRVSYRRNATTGQREEYSRP